MQSDVKHSTWYSKFKFWGEEKKINEANCETHADDEVNCEMHPEVHSEMHCENEGNFIQSENKTDEFSSESKSYHQLPENIQSNDENQMMENNVGNIVDENLIIANDEKNCRN